MPRSLYKIDYSHKKILAIAKLVRLVKAKNVETTKGGQKKLRKIRRLLNGMSIQVYKKASVIVKEFLKRKVFIHDGMYFQAVYIDETMIKYKLKFGQFVFTKRLGAYIHRDNKLAKKKAKILRQIAAKVSARKKKKQKK